MSPVPPCPDGSLTGQIIGPLRCFCKYPHRSCENVNVQPLPSFILQLFLVHLTTEGWNQTQIVLFFSQISFFGYLKKDTKCIYSQQCSALTWEQHWLLAVFLFSVLSLPQEHSITPWYFPSDESHFGEKGLLNITVELQNYSKYIIYDFSYSSTKTEEAAVKSCSAMQKRAPRLWSCVENFCPAVNHVGSMMLWGGAAASGAVAQVEGRMDQWKQKSSC